MAERVRWRAITRALMSFPFLPRSLVTTTLGFEVKVKAEEDEEAWSFEEKPKIRLGSRKGQWETVAVNGKRETEEERESPAMETCWALRTVQRNSYFPIKYKTLISLFI